MSTKPRTQTQIIPIVVTTAILLIGAILMFLQVYTVGLVALAIGIFTLSLTVLAHRKSSTTLERVLTLSPRDERDSTKIQWGFALVGKITFVFMTLLGLATLAIFGATGLNFTECHTEGQAIACNITEPALIAVLLTATVAFFALVLLVSAVASVLKRD
jgi:magnesium-transporting ATPase (P-type)